MPPSRVMRAGFWDGPGGDNLEVVAEELAAGAVIQPPTRVEVHDSEELGPAT